MKPKLLLVLFFALSLASCGVKSSYYQKQVGIPNASWDYKFQPVFKIEIKDTNARYQSFFLIRHDEAYPNANIWYRLHIKGPGDSTFSHSARMEMELADAEGKWKGTGMGGVWEHVIPIATKEAPSFKKAGTYELKIEQVMRKNPLHSVLNVGLRVEEKK